MSSDFSFSNAQENQEVAPVFVVKIFELIQSTYRIF